MIARIVAIVEGHGDVKAVPVLLRRLLKEEGVYDAIVDDEPIRAKRQKLPKPEEFERYLEYALRTRGCAAVVIVIDADDDCPAELGAALLARARNRTTSIPILVALAKTEFASWLAASVVSLRGVCGIVASAEPPKDPEAIRGAKEWLQKQMPRNRAYVESRDQPELTRSFDFDQAADRCPSFARFRHRFIELLQTLRASESD